jgi:hypothetical protein
MEMIETTPAAPSRLRKCSSRPWVRAMIIAAAAAAAGLPLGNCWARPMAVVESYPVVDQIMDGEATSFVLRFDGPVDHANARLTLMPPTGPRPPLDSESGGSVTRSRRWRISTSTSPIEDSTSSISKTASGVRPGPTL